MTQEPQAQQPPPPSDIDARLNSTATGQHLLLGEFVIPRAGEDPTTVVDGVTDGLTKFWSEGGRPYAATFSKDDGFWMVWGEEAIGTIKPFIGLESDIPRGWSLCDGSNGTHDLRGYFILGSSLEDAGVATEASSAVLADHVVTQPGGHNISTTTTGPSATTGVTAGALSVASAAHTHNDGFVDSHSGTATDPHSFTSEPTPASFTLAFIEKTS